MVIGFDGSRAFVADKTGTENYSYQLLKALAKIDQNNTYLVFTRGVVLEKFPENFHFQQIKWARFWTQGGLALQTFKNHLDMLFVPAHTLPVIRKPGLKTVVTVHDLGSEYLPKYHQLKQRLYLGFMQKYQLKTATKIIAVSYATKEDLVKKVGCDARKVSMVYEGYNEKLFKPVKSDTLVNTLKYYELRTNNYFLFVGTVQPRKNLERVIKAYARLLGVLSRKTLPAPQSVSALTEIPSSQVPSSAPPLASSSLPLLVIAGSEGWLSDDIYKLPKKLGIENRVKFLGHVPDEQLPALYSGALALVFPSLFEGFGLPILEAQACGCPVITSNLSSMPEVAGKGALYVNPYDVEAIVHAMIRVQATGLRLRGRSDSRSNRQQLIKAGLENIKRFSWEKCARETLKVLENA